MPLSTDTALFGRRARLTLVVPPERSFSTTEPGVNAAVIDGTDEPGALGLRVTATVTKTTQKEPNSAEVVVYNLAPVTRGQLQQRGVRLILEAGYRGTGLALLFVGDVRTADHVRDGSDWRTVLRCGDGERAFRFARASLSFRGGTTVGDVVRSLADSLGLALGNAEQKAAALKQVLYQGWAAHGAASTELERVLTAAGLSYSIQDGALQLLGVGEGLTQSVPQISPETGLVGSTELGSAEKKGKPQGLRFRSLLLPSARPGGRVHLVSERYDGVFRLRRVEHRLDTHGGDWYSDFDAVADGAVRVTS